MLNTLKSVISGYNITAYGGNLFYNKHGPNSNSTESDIYISCLPTGNSEETTQVTYNKEAIKFDIDIFSNPIFKFITGALIFILSFYIISLVIRYFNGDVKKK